MTKLEELSELLVSEIEQFEKTVEKLQKIQEQKILIDSRALELILEQHQTEVKKVLENHSIGMKNLGDGLEKAKAYPIWALATFTVSLIVNAVLIYILIASL